jgi:hypothetical protein
VPLKELITPPTAVAFLGTLKPGDTDKTTGGDVSRLQWFLYKEKYLDPYQLTGVFDEQTRLALSNFQIENKLVNASNPDPAVLGLRGLQRVTNLSRESQLRSCSRESAAAVARVPSLPEQGASVVATGCAIPMSTFSRLFRGWLVVMIFVTLLLVLGRSLGLVGTYRVVKSSPKSNNAAHHLGFTQASRFLSQLITSRRILPRRSRV